MMNLADIMSKVLSNSQFPLPDKLNVSSQETFAWAWGGVVSATSTYSDWQIPINLYLHSFYFSSLQNLSVIVSIIYVK